jgi:hypothetical protein
LSYKNNRRLAAAQGWAIKRHSEDGRKKLAQLNDIAALRRRLPDAQGAGLFAVIVTVAINTGIAARSMAAMIQNA